MILQNISSRKLIYILSVFFLTVPILTAQNNATVKHPDWSYKKSIYEVNIRQYTQEGTFKAFEKHLPRLKEMGVGILWLMPINPIGEKNRKGTAGSYYSVKDYLSVNPEFGTAEDFKSLINKIHSMGMYVIVDWVANHTAWDNALAAEHPDWFTKDDDGNFVPPVADWSDVIDLNYDNNDLRRYMIDALKYWIKEFNIDGYRCDVAGMVPTEFWIEARKELDEIKDVFMLAEWSTPDMHKAFDMTYSWDLFHLMNDVAAGKKNASDLYNYFAKDFYTYGNDDFRMIFTSNHDENSWNGTVFERLGNAAETFAVYTFLVPGMPLIYSGQEGGLNKRLEFFEKDLIEWKESSFGELYKVLVHLKLNNRALYCGADGGSFIPVMTSSSDTVQAFIRGKNENKLFAVFNFSPDSKTVYLSSPLINDDYIDYFTGDTTTFNSSILMKLKPWEYKVFVK
ncbi:MAG: alpha-amylase [Ignavibacteriaceae bacterium]|nr:alpha-amylase [Ignavibacteriaceae bacterium]